MRRDRLGADLAFRRGGLRRAHQFVLRAIVERDRQRRAPVMRGARDRILDQRNDVGRERVPIADDLEPHVIGGKFLDIADDEPLEQAHQIADLVLGPLPVFGREGVEGQRLDAQVAGRAHDVADRLDPRAMPGDARQVALLGPAAVAIHDDGDMVGTVMRFGHRRNLKLRSP